MSTTSSNFLLTGVNLPDGAESGAGDAVGGCGSGAADGVAARGGDVAGVEVGRGVGGDSADGVGVNVTAPAAVRARGCGGWDARCGGRPD